MESLKYMIDKYMNDNSINSTRIYIVWWRLYEYEHVEQNI